MKMPFVNSCRIKQNVVLVYSRNGSVAKKNAQGLKTLYSVG
jgi:hypothetical protein